MNITDELRQELIELATEVTREAISYFEKAIEKNGVVFTTQLRNSFEYRIIQQASSLAVSGEILFKGYGRFKDMRSLTYAFVPPVDVMEEYVDKIGLGQFAYVPGYNGTTAPTAPDARMRIAWAIALGLKKAKIVKRDNPGWYNRTKADFMNVMRRKLMERAQGIVAKGMREQMEG